MERRRKMNGDFWKYLTFCAWSSVVLVLWTKSCCDLRIAKVCSMCSFPRGTTTYSLTTYRSLRPLKDPGVYVWWWRRREGGGNGGGVRWMSNNWLRGLGCKKIQQISQRLRGVTAPHPLPYGSAFSGSSVFAVPIHFDHVVQDVILRNGLFYAYIS